MRLKAFAGPFGVCYQVVTRTTWQLVALSGPHLNSISFYKAAAAVAPSRATTRCPASLLASRRTYTALYHPDLYQRVSRYKTGAHQQAELRAQGRACCISSGLAVHNCGCGLKKGL